MKKITEGKERGIKMKEIRCKHCGKLLCKAKVADIEIICPRCKAKNEYKVNIKQRRKMLFMRNKGGIIKWILKLLLNI
jgi:phage FluMu protein Com